MNLGNRPVLIALILAAAACGGTDANKSGADVTDLTSAAYALPSPASIEVDPASASLGVGARIKFASRLVDRTGRRVIENMGTIPRWESSDTTIATVSQTGIVTGIRTGSATIRAVTGRQTGSGLVLVGNGSVASATSTAASTPPATPSTPTAPTAPTTAAAPAPATPPSGSEPNPVATQPTAEPVTPASSTPTTPVSNNHSTEPPPAVSSPVVPPAATVPPPATVPVAAVPANTEPAASHTVTAPATTAPATTAPATSPAPPLETAAPHASAPQTSPVTPPPATVPPPVAPPVAAAPAPTAPAATQTASGPGLTGFAIVADDFTRYTSTADLLANISSLAGGTGNYKAVLYSDGMNGQLAELDNSVRYNGHPTMKYNQPGGQANTPQLHVYFPATDHIWYRVKVRFSPGFTTTGTITNSANAYKLISWGWSGFDGSGRIEITNTTQYELYENVQTGPSLIGGGTYMTAGNISTEWSDGGWYDYIVEVDHSQAPGVIRLWRGKDGQAPVYQGQVLEKMNDGSKMPSLTNIAVGLNFNQIRTANQNQAVWWGQWEVIDGSQHQNPFGVSP